MEDMFKNKMIKLIIFDLDGVLCDCKDLHYESLNRALSSLDSKFSISMEEHLSKYDGLNTTKKLSMLTADKGLPVEYHNSIWEKKQAETTNLINAFTVDARIVKILEKLKLDGVMLAVASNSIRNTVKTILLRLGFMEHIDFFFSNQDVKTPKPSPEMYLSCMIKAGVSPKETLIIEDSNIGRKAANDSGAHVMPVRNSNDVTYEQINYMLGLLKDKPIIQKWQGGKMKILIPMAGAGSRFEKAGFSFPKPLIPIKNMNDKPMIQVIVENLNIDAEYIFIIRKEQSEKYNLKQLLNVISPNCKIVEVNHLTDGAACTTLLAKEFINDNEPLLIANSDQFIEWDSNEFMYSMMGNHIDGGILTFENSHPKWSYVKTNSLGNVTMLREKEVISNIATVGIYYWKCGKEYVKYAEQMISKNIKSNGEFYVAPVYSEALLDNKTIKTFNIDKMWGLGTPEDLEYFTEKYDKQN